MGLAILAIAAIAKIITIPMTKKQFESAEQMKEMQEKTKQIKKKYDKNPEKMNQELMKVQTKYMPAQFAGCLPIIISLIILIQIRGVVVNLVNQGYHSFNEVAYTQSFQKEEDAIIYKQETPLANGSHTVKLTLESEKGNRIEKIYNFEVVQDIKVRQEEIKNAELDKSERQREKERNEETDVDFDRKADISVFMPVLDKSKVTVPIKSFLFFTTEAKNVNLVQGEVKELAFYVRPPSNQRIDETKTTISLDNQDITSTTWKSTGEKINLDFLGMNLSKVGSEYWGDWVAFIPYLILAIFIGFSQFVTGKIQMGISVNKNEKQGEKKQVDKKKKQVEEQVDFSEAMQQSSQQMIYFMPLMTVVLSLGFLGGASAFPSAVSIFWTAQNVFVIIQLVVTKKEEVVELFKQKIIKYKLDKVFAFLSPKEKI